ncbi:expressed unknown protein [Seminavis robusta]|uniref:Uncharacterized protein n=1 Tax=Seminavis robusta TaxID=568900 RepID=A0A9N8HAT9_9STRA|nr:expressed unknown protein [Seminavis robusta]|eukprot:Sro253_g099900.1 n/a (237) ;mRNA; r:44518-45228
MSDLGPFVAAHLRDKVVADLLQENKQLKIQLKSSRRIAIAGPGGSPVYAEKDFAHGRYDPTERAGEWWEVPFSEVPGQQTDNCCTLSTLPTCEVRIGSFVKLKMGEFDQLYVSNYSRELAMVKVKYSSIDPCLEVGVHIPMSEPLFQSIYSRTQRLDSGSSLFMDLIPTDTDLPVIFEEVVFHAESARQALLDFGVEGVEWLDREDTSSEESATEGLGKTCSGRTGTGTGKSTGTP